MSQVGDALSTGSTDTSGANVDQTFADATLGDQMMGGSGDIFGGSGTNAGSGDNSFNSFNDVVNALSGGGAGAASPTTTQALSMSRRGSGDRRRSRWRSERHSIVDHAGRHADIDNRVNRRTDPEPAATEPELRAQGGDRPAQGVAQGVVWQAARPDRAGSTGRSKRPVRAADAGGWSDRATIAPRTPPE
jgi:hypothetical protein